MSKNSATPIIFVKKNQNDTDTVMFANLKKKEKTTV